MIQLFHYLIYLVENTLLIMYHHKYINYNNLLKCKKIKKLDDYVFSQSSFFSYIKNIIGLFLIYKVFKIKNLFNFTLSS